MTVCVLGTGAQGDLGGGDVWDWHAVLLGALLKHLAVTLCQFCMGSS
jgi:hypothetical protein